MKRISPRLYRPGKVESRRVKARNSSFQILGHRLFPDSIMTVRRLNQLRGLLPMLMGVVVGFLPTPALSQGIAGGRYQEVGFLVNPLARGNVNTMSSGGLRAPLFNMRNISVDGANYISLRAFIGRRVGSTQAFMHADEEDATSPSVETFLEKRLAGNFVFNKQQRDQGKRLRTAEINVEGEAHAEEPPAGEGRRLNVYGTDQRKWFDWDAYPDRAYGKLMFPKAYFCTGQLIGRYHVLTAAHCFFSYGNQIDGDNMYKSIFRVGYHTINGQHFFANASNWNKLWYGTTYPEVYRNSDWAIIQLDEPLGDTQGYLGINPTNLKNELPLENKFQLIGYSEDGYSQTAGKDPRCSLEEFRQGVYFHNCDCMAGASGGAILDPANNVVAINTAHIMPKDPSLIKGSDYNANFPNIGVPAAQFMPTYAHILTQASEE